ncbi:hypothetical protein [Streptomyces sp. NPDC048248]|uniref:hypothetical protein n=1 Tax=Streptomyces sp. NPDC048248 TaxID=3365523 RepID=UPI00371EE405
MRTISRAGTKGAVAGALAAMTMAMIPGQATAADLGPTASPDAYVKWLEGKSDAGANEVAKQFKALPAEKQTKFLEDLKDPELNKNFLSAGSGDKAAVRAANAAGDAVVESGTEGGEGTGGIAARAASDDRWASHWVTDTLFGIKVTKVELKVRYRVSGGKVTKVLGSAASYYNYVPATSFKNTPVKEWVSAAPASNAHAETTWTGDITGLAEWSCVHHIWADGRGLIKGELKRV